MTSHQFSKISKFKMENFEINIIIDPTLIPTPKAGEPDVLSKETFLNTHYHTIHEIFLVGETPLVIQTKTTSQEFSNCIVFVPPFVKHTTLTKTAFRLLLSYKKLNAYSSSFGQTLEELLSQETIFACESTTIQYECCKKLEQLLYLPKNELTDEIYLSLLKIFLFDIFNTNKKSSTPVQTDSINESYLIILDDIIQNKYNQHISLKYVADMLHLSSKQVSRIIQNYFHSPLSVLINNKRLDVACTLLTTTDEPISKIVTLVNFSSESYFFAQFKKAFNCTPLEYRNNALN